jgi:hypothetical protein
MFYVSKDSGFYSEDNVFVEGMSIEVDAPIEDVKLYALSSNNEVHLITKAPLGSSSASKSLVFYYL